MVHITLIVVGKLKERFWTDACNEYIKRLGAFCKIQEIEVEESRLPQNPKAAQIDQALKVEGENILAKIPPKAKVIALCIEGEMLSSETFSTQLSRLCNETSDIALIIGGSHGLSEAVKKIAVRRLSISPMTFPHQLCRVLLLEQLYRGFSIQAGNKYHK